MAVIPKIRAVCHCNDATFDASCLEDLCVQNYRMAGACECTCKVMLFQSCAVFTPIADCSCIDGTTKPGQIIDSVWVGWIDATAGKTLADIASLTCDGNPTVFYRLYGFMDGEWTGCLTGGGHPIKWDGVNEVVIDLPANALVTCSAGVAQIPASDFNLTITPTPGGTGTDCTQVGGYPVLAVEATDQCGHTLVFCPFAGVVGEGFACSEICCTFTITTAVTPCDNEDTPGIGHVVITYSSPATCDCEVTTRIFTNTAGDGTGGTEWDLNPAGGMIPLDVPCDGADVTFYYKVINTYSGPCAALCPDNADVFSVVVPLAGP